MEVFGCLKWSIEELQTLLMLFLGSGGRGTVAAGFNLKMQSLWLSL